ncbi:hypothetical protein [Streptomyces sp. 303MFCol5.2]|uniref:hypothetical protein n=1 Tax=Streptomyces sp. 303MFCol5.2 TaxID=1172181 RepID=UPI00035E129D|nr:hypothetical protein [Streptomyces sp. 303MFCol5.2]
MGQVRSVARRLRDRVDLLATSAKVIGVGGRMADDLVAVRMPVRMPVRIPVWIPVRIAVRERRTGQ